MRQTASKLLRTTIYSFVIATPLSIVGFAHNAQAGEGDTYVSAFFGGTSAPDIKDTAGGLNTFHNGYEASIALGYGLSNDTRIEAEIIASKVAISSISLPGLNGGNPQDASGSISSKSLMLNGYYDFDVNLPMTPYIGAGAGLTNVSVNNASVPGFLGTNDKDQAFSWQFKAGLSKAISDNLDINVGYRYFDTQRLSLTSNLGTKFTTEGAAHHTFGIGLTRRF